MSDIYEEYEYDESDGLAPPQGFVPDFEDSDSGVDPPFHFRELSLDCGNSGSFPKQSLKSRPAIDFSGKRLINPTNLSWHPASLMSGSTLRSSNPSMAHSSSHKMLRVPSTPTLLSPEVISSLTVHELSFNPHYRKLRQKYDTLAETLTGLLRRDLAESEGCEAFEPGIMNVDQEPPRRADSRTSSSLGPSDSASQQPSIDRAIDNLLESVEAPHECPSYLPITILWDYEHCKTDVTYGPIITESNQCRPKMDLAIRRPNGTKISNHDYRMIQRSADILVQELIDLVDADPRVTLRGPKTRTKTFIRNLFKAQYHQAILRLEAEYKLLRLCSAHWKADSLLGRGFRRYAEAEAKAAKLAQPTAAAPTPDAGNMAPTQLAKRSLELTPGPKSPSASHAQKRSKDGATLKTAAVPSNKSLRPPPHKIVPDFLIFAEPTSVEVEPTPGPTALRPVFVDPSVDNLVAILKSKFPSLTNAPALLHSMHAQLLFKQGETSKNVSTLLARLQSADPGSPDIDEDNACQGWGHDLFTAGGLSPSNSLTSWQEVGSVATALKLVAAALKICQEARMMCSNAGIPKTNNFISDVYLEQVLDQLENCWVSAGGTITSPRVPAIPTTPPSYRDAVMASPPQGLTSPPRTIKFKIKLPPPSGVAANHTTDVPSGTTSTSQPQPATSAEPQEPLVVDEDTGTTLLKTLQVSELVAWISTNGLSMPKLKRKDDLILAILNSPTSTLITKSAIQDIVAKRKTKKGPM